MKKGSVSHELRSTAALTLSLLFLLLALLALAPNIHADYRRLRPDVRGADFSPAPPTLISTFADYSGPARIVRGRRALAHYLPEGYPGGVSRTYAVRAAAAASHALDYYQQRGFRSPAPDIGGPDSQPDVYLALFTSGVDGIAYPAARSDDGPFAVVSSQLSSDLRLDNLEGTVAHEMFHLVQFSYFPSRPVPVMPRWLAEGSAEAMEAEVYPRLNEASSLQFGEWLKRPGDSLYSQGYGAASFWLYLDSRAPKLLPRLFKAIGAGTKPRAALAAAAAVSGHSLAQLWSGFAVVAAGAPELVTEPDTGRPRRGLLPPLAASYLEVGRSAVLVLAGPTLTVKLLKLQRGLARPRVKALAAHKQGPLWLFPARKPGRYLLLLANGGLRPQPYALVNDCLFTAQSLLGLALISPLSVSGC